MIFMDFIRNPQTTIALTFLIHIISGIDGVKGIKTQEKFADIFNYGRQETL